MIIVPKYHGRLGNNLFQYVWPRILSTILGYRFIAPPLLNLETDIPGEEYDNPIQEVQDFAPHPGVVVPIGEVINRRDHRKIIIQGFFQQADKYTAYRSMIKEWFSSSLTPVEHPKGTLGISIRIAKADFGALGWDLPLSYYKIAIQRAMEAVSPTKCFFYADVPAIDLIDHVNLISKGCDVRVLSHLDPLSQFQSMMGCPNIIGCNSTFSWWSAFLSNAKNVWMPFNWQPWGATQKRDKDRTITTQYPVDLRCYQEGWHIVDMNGIKE